MVWEVKGEVEDESEMSVNENEGEVEVFLYFRDLVHDPCRSSL